MTVETERKCEGIITRATNFLSLEPESQCTYEGIDQFKKDKANFVDDYTVGKMVDASVEHVAGQVIGNTVAKGAMIIEDVASGARAGTTIRGCGLIIDWASVVLFGQGNPGMYQTLDKKLPELRKRSSDAIFKELPVAIKDAFKNHKK